MTAARLAVAKRHPTLLLFLTCVAAVIGVLAWLTLSVLGLERREAQARAESALADSVRLALWRMDSSLTPVLAREAARPYFHYASFYPAERAYNQMLQPRKDGDVLVPSPLLTADVEFVRLFFQINPDETVTSPAVPTGNLRDLAESQFVGARTIVGREVLLGRLSASHGTLVSAFHDEQKVIAANEVSLPWAAPAPVQPQASQQLEAQASPGQVEQQRAFVDKQARVQTAAQAYNQAPAIVGKGGKGGGDAKSDAGGGAGLAAVDGCTIIDQTRLTPMWVSLSGGAAARATADDSELFLVRSVNLDGQSILQGVWVDWPSLRASLLARTSDLFPSGTLRPARNSLELSDGESLASIPAVFEAGPPPQGALSTGAPVLGLTPTRLTLVVAWASLLGAVAAIGMGLRASTELGERRGRFVSAVTHELRTPLTTFCLYSQMLDDGMVSDDVSRTEYVRTLRRESDRLARIVENVLCYARLADLRADVHTERADAGEVLGRIVPRLATRAAEAGMRLEVDTDGVRGRTVLVDVQTLERILINLVDNACKYAAGETDNRVHLTAVVSPAGPNGMIELHVADHGPGIPRRDWKRVFRAFERGSSADGSNVAAKPGLGLGLSLARGLAREQGGDLRLVNRPGFGAVFAVAVPVVG